MVERIVTTRAKGDGFGCRVRFWDGTEGDFFFADEAAAFWAAWLLIGS
jgi:hypothetical protein